MTARKNRAVRNGHGVMCNICGKNWKNGDKLEAHIERAHAPVTHDAYTICFFGGVKNILADSWDDLVTTSDGGTVVVYVIARFIQEPGPRGAASAVRKQFAG